MLAAADTSSSAVSAGLEVDVPALLACVSPLWVAAVSCDVPQPANATAKAKIIDKNILIFISLNMVTLQD
ncbi:hypothetical protein D3C71_2149020 [compost metagenome]